MTIVFDKRLNKAMSMEECGNLVEALKAYRDVYALDTHCQPAILGLGRTALALGRTELAFDFFVKLLIENHDHPWGYWGRAAVFFEYRQIDRALREIARAVELDTPPSSLRIDCAALLNSEGYYAEALNALQPVANTGLFDDDAEIEWCYASLKLARFDDITAHCIDQKTEDDGAIWLLLKGLYLNHITPGSGLPLIHKALALEPELNDRI